MGLVNVVNQGEEKKLKNLSLQKLDELVKNQVKESCRT